MRKVKNIRIKLDYEYKWLNKEKGVKINIEDKRILWDIVYVNRGYEKGRINLKKGIF